MSNTVFDASRQIAIIWSVEDVQQVRCDLTDCKAMEVLKLVKRTHDSNYGVTWETLREAADTLFPQ